MLSLPRLLWVNFPQRGNIKALSSLTKSRYVSVPVDDQENSSVISNLLVRERKRSLTSIKKLEDTDDNTSGRNNILHREILKKPRKANGTGPKVNAAQKVVAKVIDPSKIKNANYIVGQDAVNTLVKHLKKDLRDEDVIVESNIGPGILTRTLLKQTNNRIIAYEHHLEFLLNLQPELDGYAARIEMHNLDLLKFYWYYTLSKRASEPIDEPDKLVELMQPLHAVEDGKTSSIKIVAALCEKKFFHNLTLSFTFQCCFFEKKYPEFYLYIPEYIYNGLMSSSASSWSSRLRIPFLFYFDIQPLDTAPSADFYTGKFRKISYKMKANSIFHLVKVTPKSDVHEILPKEELATFHYFMRCLNKARMEESLIFHMEKWIPGCGIDYIKNGFRMFKHPRQLTLEELLKAYKLFKSLPSYEESMFHQFCKNWTIQFGLKDDVSFKTETDDASDKEDGFGDCYIDDEFDIKSIKGGFDIDDKFDFKR